MRRWCLEEGNQLAVALVDYDCATGTTAKVSDIADESATDDLVHYEVILFRVVMLVLGSLHHSAGDLLAGLSLGCAMLHMLWLAPCGYKPLGFQNSTERQRHTSLLCVLKEIYYLSFFFANLPRPTFLGSFKISVALSSEISYGLSVFSDLKSFW